MKKQLTKPDSRRRPPPLCVDGYDTLLVARLDSAGYPWVQGTIVDLGSEIECCLDAEHAEDIAEWFKKYAAWAKGKL